MASVGPDERELVTLVSFHPRFLLNSSLSSCTMNPET